MLSSCDSGRVGGAWRHCSSSWPTCPRSAQRTLEHVSIVGVAVGLAILTGVPIGIAITQNKRAADIVLYVAAMIMTIPSIALFGVMIPLLSLIGQGIGYLPAVIARAALFAAADHPQHLHGDHQRRSGAARGGARHGHDDAAAAARGRAADRAAGHHGRRAHRGRASTSGSPPSRPISAPAGSARSSAAASRRPTSRQLITGALAVSLLAIFADYFLLWVQRC